MHEPGGGGACSSNRRRRGHAATDAHAERCRRNKKRCGEPPPREAHCGSSDRADEKKRIPRPNLRADHAAYSRIGCDWFGGRGLSAGPGVRLPSWASVPGPPRMRHSRPGCRMPRDMRRRRLLLVVLGRAYVHRQPLSALAKRSLACWSPCGSGCHRPPAPSLSRTTVETVGPRIAGIWLRCSRRPPDRNTRRSSR